MNTLWPSRLPESPSASLFFRKKEEKLHSYLLILQNDLLKFFADEAGRILGVPGQYRGPSIFGQNDFVLIRFEDNLRRVFAGLPLRASLSDVRCVKMDVENALSFISNQSPQVLPANAFRFGGSHRGLHIAFGSDGFFLPQSKDFIFSLLGSIN